MLYEWSARYGGSRRYCIKCLTPLLKLYECERVKGQLSDIAQDMKEELIDYAVRSGAPLEVLENLQEIEDEGDVYDSIEDIWPDYPTKEDFLFNEDEY